MSPRRTIGESPLDAVVPVGGNSGGGQAVRAQREPARRGRARAPKERVTVQLPLELTERVRNAVYWTPGLTVAGLAEQALTTALEAMEAERGQAFAPRREELKPGRPVR